MDWYIHHVNLPAHDIGQSRAFYRDIVGLPEGEWTYPPAAERGHVPEGPDTMVFFGTENRGLHIVKPIVTFAKNNNLLHNPTVGGHIAITVSDIELVMQRLDAAGIVYSNAKTYAMAGIHQVYVYEPGLRLIEINQSVSDLGAAPPEAGEQHALRMEPGDWFLHHVNLQAFDVRATAKFFTDIVGLKEGVWDYPDADQLGTFTRDDDHITNFGIKNQGIHLVKPAPSFAADNGLVHNPTIGGHFAITVKDVGAVIDRLKRADIAYTDAGTYAMAGVHQVYTYDPSMNFVEINQLP